MYNAPWWLIHNKTVARVLNEIAEPFLPNDWLETANLSPPMAFPRLGFPHCAGRYPPECGVPRLQFPHRGGIDASGQRVRLRCALWLYNYTPTLGFAYRAGGYRSEGQPFSTPVYGSCRGMEGFCDPGM